MNAGEKNLLAGSYNKRGPLHIKQKRFIGDEILGQVEYGKRRLHIKQNRHGMYNVSSMGETSAKLS